MAVIDQSYGRLLHAKYYPIGQLKDTIFSLNPSLTWQGILFGLELLKKGLIWRTRKGRGVKIWRDRWVPRKSSHKIIFPKGRCGLRWCLDLFDIQGSWNIPLIRQHFSSWWWWNLSIKPSRHNHVDFLPGRVRSQEILQSKVLIGLPFRTCTELTSLRLGGRLMVTEGFGLQFGATRHLRRYSYLLAG